MKRILSLRGNGFAQNMFPLSENTRSSVIGHNNYKSKTIMFSYSKLSNQFIHYRKTIDQNGNLSQLISHILVDLP